jgi:nicotinamidase/pyrazinamidase
LLTPAIDAIAQLIVSKGMDPNVEAYSGFDGTWLADILHTLDIVNVVIGGLATDYCVRATALAAQREGFMTTVIADAIRAVDVKPGDGERALEEMRQAGVAITRADAVR